MRSSWMPRPSPRRLIALSGLALGLGALLLLGRPPEQLVPQPSATPIIASIPPGLAALPASLSSYSNIELVTLPKQQLDVQLRPLALHGDHYVGQSASGELFLIDLRSGSEQQLTDDGRPKWSAVLSERYAAWIAQAGERQYTATDGQADTQLLAHVMVYDRLNGSTRRITAEPMPRDSLALSGERLVWADKRNELDGFYTHYDLYGYDLRTGSERAIAVAPGAQAAADISGDTVVWQDNRDSPTRGQPMDGCGNCPENRFDLYMYDWNNGVERVLVSDGTLNGQPRLDGQRLAWVKHSSWTKSDIYLLELDTGTARRITDTAARSVGPLLSGTRLVWQVPHPCDDIQLGPDGREIRPPAAVYELDLETDRMRALIGYVDVGYLIDGDTTLIDEGCMLREKAYLLRGP